MKKPARGGLRCLVVNSYAVHATCFAMQCRPVVFLSVATLIDFPPYGNGDSLGREQVDALYMGKCCP